jgi:hypothetical protein
MSRRRFLSASILLAWLSAPTLGTLSAATRDSHDECSGHVCQCQRHCPPRRPAGKSCHEDPGGARSYEMTSRCNHESNPPPGTTRSDSIPSPAQVLSPRLEWSPGHELSSARPEAGYSRIDPQPPRAAS